MARIQAINPTVATLKRTDDDLPRRVPDGADRQGGRAPAPVFVELHTGSMSGGRGSRVQSGKCMCTGGVRLGVSSDTAPVTRP